MDSTFCLFVSAYVRMQVPTKQRDQKRLKTMKPLVNAISSKYNIGNNFYESAIVMIVCGDAFNPCKNRLLAAAPAASH